MKWSIFATFAFIGVLLDTSLLHVLRLDLGPLGGIVPSFCLCLVVFISLFAQRTSALWACWCLGLLLDLCTGDPRGQQVLGPHALGFTLGSYFVLQLRSMVFRRRTLTVGVLVFVAALLAHLMIIAIHVIRGWSPSFETHWTELGTGRELVRRALIALYTAVLALPLGWILIAGANLWGFHSSGPSLGGSAVSSMSSRRS